MHTVGIESSIAKARKDREEKSIIKVGQRVQLVSGVLTGLAGVVVRCEQRQIYVIGIPDADSNVLVRVQRQRFRCLKPNPVKNLAPSDRAGN